MWKSVPVEGHADTLRFQGLSDKAPHGSGQGGEKGLGHLVVDEKVLEITQRQFVLRAPGDMAAHELLVLFPADVSAQEQRLAEVLAELHGGTWVPFSGLLAGSRTREELVLTFLALLELVRTGRARLVQTELFGEIRVQAA